MSKIQQIPSWVKTNRFTPRHIVKLLRKKKSKEKFENSKRKITCLGEQQLE